MHARYRSTCEVIVVDAGSSRYTCLECDTYIDDHCLGYCHDYSLFCQLPKSNLFTHRLLFFSREATSETYSPGSLSHIICLCDLFYLPFIFRSTKLKNKNILLQFILFGVRSINIYYSLTSIFQFVAPLLERDWQPLLHVGLQVVVICVQVLFTLCCLVLLLVR